jgi:hypothetical protein
MHSVSSDGLHPAADVLQMAAEGGLDVIALTDHDLSPRLEAGQHEIGGHSIRVLGAVELSTMHADEELHLLVYFPKAMPEAFAEWCTNRARWRAGWYDASIDALGLDGMEKADADAHRGKRCLTRMHLARAVVAAGHAPSLHQAFRTYIGSAAGRIPHLNLSFLDALSVARDAGAWTSWAHPPPKLAQDWTAEFAAHGLHALECHRPAGGSQARNRMARLAHQHGLGMTGGSDWHGWEKRRLGSFRVRAQELWRTADALALY